MITREDMRFATCHQLAAMIVDDWDNWPSAVIDASVRLSCVNEPDGSFVGTGLNGLPSIKLEAGESEPKSIQTAKRLFALNAVSHDLRLILKHSDGWHTELSDKFKKELTLRVKEYEDDIKRITDPVVTGCEIKL